MSQMLIDCGCGAGPFYSLADADKHEELMHGPEPHVHDWHETTTADGARLVHCACGNHDKPHQHTPQDPEPGCEYCEEAAK